MSKKQILFELIISGAYDTCRESNKKLDALIKEGYIIVNATPILSGKCCYTYTSAIVYVLEKEVEVIENE